MGLFKKFVNQTRKPEGALGKMMLRSMNTGHSALTNWGFAHLPPMAPEQIVDLGCGGGTLSTSIRKREICQGRSLALYSTASSCAIRR